MILPYKVGCHKKYHCLDIHTSVLMIYIFHKTQNAIERTKDKIQNNVKRWKKNTMTTYGETFG